VLADGVLTICHLEQHGRFCCDNSHGGSQPDHHTTRSHATALLQTSVRGFQALSYTSLPNFFPKFPIHDEVISNQITLEIILRINLSHLHDEWHIASCKQHYEVSCVCINCSYTSASLLCHKQESAVEHITQGQRIANNIRKIIGSGPASGLVWRCCRMVDVAG